LKDDTAPARPDAADGKLADEEMDDLAGGFVDGQIIAVNPDESRVL
jgi:acyl-CoA synthetase (NDP forming)